MRSRRNFRTFMLIYVLVGIYVFVFGGSGLLERISLSDKQSALLAHIEKLQGDKEILELKLKQYADGKLTDADFLDVGFIPPNKRMLALKGLEGPKQTDDILTDDRMELAAGLRMTHLRVIWGVVALLILLFYFSRKKKEEHDFY